MALRFGAVLITMFGLVMVLDASGKPPETPTAPDTEFKVLTDYAQEYFQAEDSRNALFLPEPTALAPDAPNQNADAPGLRGKPLTLRGGCRSFVPASANQGFQLIRAEKSAPIDLSSAVYQMAEAHRQANDLDEARRWYAGLIDLWPRSPFAKLAAARLERLSGLQIAAAGEEESEEPLLLERAERLKVMPHEAMPKLK